MSNFNRNSLMIGISLLLTNLSAFCMSDDDRKEIENRKNLTAIMWDNKLSFGRPAGLVCAGTFFGTMLALKFGDSTYAKKSSYSSYLAVIPFAIPTVASIAAEVGYFGKKDEYIKTRFAGGLLGFLSGYKLGESVYNYLDQ